MVWLRAERPEDVDGIRRVHEAAFGQPDEGALVDRLRRDGDLAMSHLADRKGEVIAHLAISPASLRSGGTAESAASGCRTDSSSPEIPGGLFALAPMAVHPDWKRQKIGSGLLRSAIERLRRRGAGALVVLGHPDYYARFGFDPASRVGLRCPFEAPDAAFRVLALRELPPDALCGVLRYARAFDDLTCDSP